MAERTYGEVRDLVESMGGTMAYHPGGGPGGYWTVELWGKTVRVDCRDDKINDLDRLYVPSVGNPETWRDYADPAELVDDARWALVDLIRDRAEA